MPDSHPQVSEASLWRVAYRTVVLIAALAVATLLAIQLQGVIIQIFLATIVACGMSPSSASFSPLSWMIGLNSPLSISDFQNDFTVDHGKPQMPCTSPVSIAALTLAEPL